MAKKKTSSVKLAASDFDPLLVAISSRSVDTCLLGARGLALLGDPRAFGLLMQLSREDSADVRLETCRSFEYLGDRRATDRLCALLDDDEVKVRDAAFTALAQICTTAKVPLEAAEQGLAVSHEDVRMRGFELLVRHAKKSKANLGSGEVQLLLKQALNDTESIRSEAFKFILNSRAAGDHEQTLRFALVSVHEDVRRDVLTEVMAEEKQPWASGLALDMLDDPNESVRQSTFAYLQKKHKDSNADQKLDWLSSAIEKQHPDIRLLACQRLVKLNTPAAQSVLSKAVNDDDNKVRRFALKSLIDRNAREDLIAVLQSKHVGVKLAAATALANQGDSAARPVLEEFVNVPQPDKAEVGEERVQVWENLTKNAISGLAQLQDTSTLPLFVELCSHQNNQIRREAASALRFVTNADSVESLQPLLRSEDEHVQLSAAYACALLGDVVAARTVLATTDSDSISPGDRLCVAVALGESTEVKLVQLLGIDSEIVQPNTALLVLLCRDWLDHDGTPRRIIAALSACDARLRLLAARALRAFSDSDSLGEVIADLFNHRADGQHFKIESEVIHAVASVLVFGRGSLLCHLIAHLETLAEAKQEKWDNSWLWLSQRYSSEIDAAKAAAKKNKLPQGKTDSETLDQLAFGTYVGLAREQGGHHRFRYQTRFGWSIANVREEALRRLQAMAQSDKSYLEPTVSVVTHTCGDPLHPVRFKAFEILSELGVDDRSRAEIGINSGNLDLAVEGLELLTKSAKKAERIEILTDAIHNQPFIIGREAAKMLRDEAGSVAACQVCLDAADQVGVLAASWLADDYQDDAKAKALLRKLALDSPPSIRQQAIDSLVKNKDEKAFDAIVAAVSETNPVIERSRCFRWFSQLGDSRANEFLLGLFDDPNLAVDHKNLLQVVGEFRDPAAAEKLLELMERKDLRPAAAGVLFKISGFDQTNLDPQDDWPDRLWLDSQHPRHSQVLADLMSRCLELNSTKLLSRYIPGARWCLTSEVDKPLGRLVAHADEKLRQSAVEAVSFRARKRDGDIESLQQAVEHRDPITQFLAAEGLAKSGNADGITVLMSAVEMLDDLSLRQRAVLALGCLADERALDLLLKLVTHDAHALQGSAAEAIGYLGKSEHKQKILKILLGLVAREGSVGARAIIGLRHMDVPEGWDAIRKLSCSQVANRMRNVAWEQLGYDSSDATKDLLIDLLESPKDNTLSVMASARRCYGNDSIVPDVAFLKGQQGNCGALGFQELECLQRVCDNASPDQIFELVSCCPQNARTRLTNHLLALDPLPTKQATAALADSDSQTVRLAAHVVGREGDKKQSKEIAAALENWTGRYAETSELLKRTNSDGGVEFTNLYQVCSQLIWSASRVGGANKQLLVIVIQYPADQHFEGLRRSAMKALQNAKLTAAEEKQLIPLLQDFDPLVRDAAGQLLAQKKANQQTVADALLADRHPFNRLAASDDVDFSKTLTGAAVSAHYQPRALPHLIDKKDVKTLSAVASDESLELPARLGAIEGLARMSDKNADKVLIKIGKDEAIDESLRKAAWRGLRRSKRAKAVAS